jgi:hypothetical protein
MIKKQPEPYLILVRDTQEDYWSPQVRLKMVLDWMHDNDIDGKVMIIPDIRGVYYGREVGYEVEKLELEVSVSGSEIRKSIEQEGSSWRELVPSSTAAVIDLHLKQSSTED